MINWMFSGAFWVYSGYNVVTDILVKPQNKPNTHRGRVTSNLLQSHTESKKRKEKQYAANSPSSHKAG